MTRTLLLVGLFIPTLLGSTPTFATEFRDSKSGFRMSLDIPGTLVCVLKPASLQNAAACRGLHVPEATATVSNDISLSAVLRHPGVWGAMLSVVITPTSRSAPLTREDAKEWVEGAFEQMRAERSPKVMQRLMRPGVTIDMQVVNGLQLFSYQFEGPPDPKTGIGSFLSYVFVGRAHLVTISFVTGPKKVELLLPVADALMKTVSLPATPGSPEWK